MKKYISIILCGAGQVIFQNNWFSGLLFLIGIYFESQTLGNAALLGLVSSSLIPVLFKSHSNGKQAALSEGLYGYNGLLVGLAVATFYLHQPHMWIIIALASALSSIAYHYLFLPLSTKKRIPPLTFPFILTTWVFILVPTFLAPTFLKTPTHFIEYASIDFSFFISALLKSISQIFFISNTISGLFFILAILINSPTSALLALFGAGVSIIMAFIFNFNHHDIYSGLYGYSAVLTAIALGRLKISLVLLGVAITFLLHVALGFVLEKLSLPVLTSPFVFTTWGFMYVLKNYFAEDYLN